MISYPIRKTRHCDDYNAELVSIPAEQSPNANPGRKPRPGFWPHRMLPSPKTAPSGMARCWRRIRGMRPNTSLAGAAPAGHQLPAPAFGVPVRDPEFDRKAANIVGLYPAPPVNAVVICVDEKPHLPGVGTRPRLAAPAPWQGPDRFAHEYTRPGPPPLRGVDGGHRPGAGRSLRAALPGGVQGLRESGRSRPPEGDRHVILDHLSTHKPKDDAWRRAHPRVHRHFTLPPPRGSTKWRCGSACSAGRPCGGRASPFRRNCGRPSLFSWPPTIPRPTCSSGPN